MSTAAMSRTRVPRSSLPEPPTDEEKYWYLGRQHRWLLVVQAVSFAAIAYSMIRFSITDLDLLPFLIPISLYCVTLVVSLLSSTRSRRTDLLDHELRRAEYAPGVYPSVDVFLPTAGESLAVLANTYHHVRRLEWDGPVTVWVLDDSARDEVRLLAERHGFEYRSRPDRGRLKKAGNLKYGFDQSAGDLIMILDADFVPRPDFIAELAPYFDDPDVGIVQSPQFFETRRMRWLQRCAGATQELFYRWIQPGRDRSDAAICVGTCALYRRTALQRSGGFAQIGHSEDVHTGVNMMKVGYHVRYVPVLVSRGLCPDSASAFLSQQYRWCTGSMSLLADRTFHDNPLLTPRQRLCFWAGFLYYISTAVNAFTAPLPAIAMVFLLPQYVRPMNSVWMIGALALWFLLLPLTMRGRWRVDVLRVQVLYSFAHAVAIWHVVRGRTREWVATGSAARSGTPLAVTIGRVMKTYVVLSQTALVTGLVTGTLRFGIGAFSAMWALWAVNAYIHLPLLVLRIQPAGARVSVPRAFWLRLVDFMDRPRGGPDRPPLPPPDRRFRPDIQGLRAIAVTLVVLYHAHLPGLTGGYVGVDVFFVISGFLITGQLFREVQRTGRLRLGQFYAGRVRRLLLPAAVVIAATVVVSRLWGSLFQVRGVSADAIWTALYSVNYHLAAEGVNYQQQDGPVSPLQHFWSLAVEEQFYLLWPLLVLGCALLGRRRQRERGTLAVGLSAVTAASLYLSVVVTRSNAPYAYFSLHTRAWELAAGGLLALAVPRLQRLPRSAAALASWTGVAVIVRSALAFDDATPFPGTAAIWPTLGCALVIAAGCRPTRWSAERLLNRRPMQGVGKVSYAWYLWHWPVLVLVPVITGATFDWPRQLGLSVIALWMAVLTCQLIEEPAKRSRKSARRWLGHGVLAGGGTVAASVVAVVTLPAFIGSGPATAVTLHGADIKAVQAALVEGLAVRAAPANLTPSVTAAESTQPVSTGDGCHAGFLQIAQGTCVYGDRAGTHTVVLFGDSHAQQWLPALDHVGEQLHWRVVSWTKASCPAGAVTVHNPFLKRDFTECDDWRNRTLQRISDLKPDAVVVSQSDLVPGTQMSNTRWANGAGTTVGQIVSGGSPVVFLMDTPTPRGNVPHCVADNLNDVSVCVRDRSRAYFYAGRHDAVASAVRAAGAAVIDPINWLCTARACPVIVGNMLVYRDTSHLSTVYSSYLAPMLRPVFVPRR